MSEPYSFINTHMQTYEGLKTSIVHAGKSLAKFDVLNAHIRNGVVLPGELIIIGDYSTKSCTSQEAYLMNKANEVHKILTTTGLQGDGYLIENYDLLQSMIAATSPAIGMTTDIWSKHLTNIRNKLEEINRLYKSHLKGGKLESPELFFQKRKLLSTQIEKQLASYASSGSGLRRNTAIKSLLGLSTKSYMQHGEIARYADAVAGVARAAAIVKIGGYLAVPLEMSSTYVEIKKACLAGDDRQCRRAEYVEGGKLVGSLTLGAGGGMVVGLGVAAPCASVFGPPTMGLGAVACVGVVAGIAGMGIGELGGMGGGFFGRVIYEHFYE